MSNLSEIFALFLCAAPMLAIVLWIAWLSRRPNVTCPKCSHKVAQGAAKCPACGTAMDTAKK
jgi:predicted amidophosphoribosyltransferase